MGSDTLRFPDRIFNVFMMIILPSGIHWYTLNTEHAAFIHVDIEATFQPKTNVS